MPDLAVSNDTKIITEVLKTAEILVIFEVHTYGEQTVGTSIGSPSYVESKCVEIYKSGQDLCTKLTALDNSQSALLLLQHCHVPRINHLARSVLVFNLLQRSMMN